jgi:hypothetical protein
LHELDVTTLTPFEEANSVGRRKLGRKECRQIVRSFLLVMNHIRTKDLVTYGFNHSNIEIIVSVNIRLWIRGGLYPSTKGGKERSTFQPKGIECLTEKKASDRVV